MEKTSKETPIWPEVLTCDKTPFEFRNSRENYNCFSTSRGKLSLYLPYNLTSEPRRAKAVFKIIMPLIDEMQTKPKSRLVSVITGGEEWRLKLECLSDKIFIRRVS